MSSKTVKLGHVCKIQSGGIPFQKNNISDVPTNYQVISPKDIKCGTLSSELRYLKSIDEGFEKCLVNDGQILVCGHILTNRGVAFISGFEGKTVYLHNGIFRLHTDVKKMNPLFVKMFLESNAGIVQINKLSTGVRTNLQRITAQNLQKVNIPLLDLDKQNKLAEQYRELEKEILKTADDENLSELNKAKNNIIVDALN